MNENYKQFIEDRFKIIDKDGVEVSLILNSVQAKYLTKDTIKRDIILKARQQGFSSIILARFTADFLLKENSRSVVVADKSDNAIELLERVKMYIKFYEEIAQTKVPLKYNSKYELFNEATNSKYSLGTAENVEFGRSKTITNLHLSEAAFYPHFRKLLASALQAVVPNGYAVIETTANGFNDFKSFWDESVLGETGFKPLFYKASDFYDTEFLEKKRGELKNIFPQEYPETAEEAFLTSGLCYFDKEALKVYISQATKPINNNLIYVQTI